MERILSIEIPWNLQVQAEKAIRLEQDYLKVSETELFLGSCLHGNNFTRDL